MQHLPPLNALRAFEAVARAMSFQAAARELSVTPAAVSYQVRQLEEHLGLELFHRLREWTSRGAGPRQCPLALSQAKICQL